MFNNNNGGGWVPGMGMPPLGFGVVAQQPGNRMMSAGQQVPVQTQHMAQWQQQQFLAAQMGMASATVGVQHLPQQQQQQQQSQQQGFHHFQQPQQVYPQQNYHQQQQQWMEAQKKAAEEQRKMYDQMMKQRQFDEQKMRLKAFGNTKKSGVSADAMIENILGTKDAQKPKSPPAPKKGLQNETVAPSVAVKQGTAVDWSKMENVNTLFGPTKQGDSIQVNPLASGVTENKTVEQLPANSTSSAAMPPNQLTPSMAQNQLSSSMPSSQLAPGMPPNQLAPGMSPNQLAPGMSPNQLAPGMSPNQLAPGMPPSQLAPGMLPNQLASGMPPNQLAPGMPPNQLDTQKETQVKHDHAVNSGTAAMGTGNDKKPLAKPIALPPWLADKAILPAIYKHAVSLVEGKDGWVDTNRAYMLLMKTGLPPPFLGILWEMVNRTQPGQLLDQEFTTLLALVALVQSGQAITNADILSSTSEAVLPIIDHPALLPLVQDYIQQRQQVLAQHEQEQQQHLSNTSLAKENEKVTNDDDEFEDFVSGPTMPSDPVTGDGTASSISESPPVAPVTFPNIIAPMHQPISTHPEASSGLQQLGTKTLPPCMVEKMKRMNLPEVGVSPELSPSTSFDQAPDDEFDDFQSASMTNMHSSVPAEASRQDSHSALETSVPFDSGVAPVESIGSSNSAGDKYAVFRELEKIGDDTNTGNTTSSISDIGNNDDSFGDFCCSEPASLTMASSTFPPIMSSNTAGSGTNNTTPVSFEVFSTPPEVPESSVDAPFEADFGVFNSAPVQPTSNYADIHEAMKRVEEEQKQKVTDSWSDPFGEFEEAGRAPSNSNPPIPQLNVVGHIDDDDDDFGDFMGPDGGLTESEGLAFSQPFPKISEPLGETQSVASLELPGLEMTVGLQATENRGSGAGQSPDIFMQARGDMTSAEDQLRGLSLEPTLTSSDLSSTNGTCFTAGVNGSTCITPSVGTNTVLDSFGGGLMDKYSIIREEAAKSNYDEAHIGSWQRCLEGSVKLLEQGHGVLIKLVEKKLKSEVLATTQMQDYLANLQEVWQVCDRISKSSQRVTTSSKVDQLLSKAKTLWQEIMVNAGASLAKQMDTPEAENQMTKSEVCGVCLAGGGSKLTYGGHSYHPPCANLWLNCVDLLLPSLTPVTLL